MTEAMRQGPTSTYQLEEVLPEVLRHEAEQRQESPAEGVVAGVAVVGVPPCLHALVSLRALPAKGQPASGPATAPCAPSACRAFWVPRDP